MKELIVKPKFSGKIIINSDYLEKHIINLSMKGGYHYEMFEYAWAYYRLKPWLYDIYGEYLLLYKLLRKALENDRITIPEFIIMLRESFSNGYTLSKLSWVQFPTTLCDIFEGVYDKMSYDGFFKENNLNEHIMAMGFRKLAIQLMFSIWNGKPIGQKEIKIWVGDIDSLIRYLLVNNRKEEGIKYWEENTIKQINLATME